MVGIEAMKFFPIDANPRNQRQVQDAAISRTRMVSTQHRPQKPSPADSA
jgi:hypothetical protein